MELEANSARFDADMGKVRSSLAQVQRGFNAMGGEIEISRRTMSAAGTEVRFMAATFLSKLDPALGGVVSQFASLSSLGNVTAIGITALVAGAGALALELWKVHKAAEALAKAFRDWDLPTAEAGTHALNVQLNDLQQLLTTLEPLSVEFQTVAELITKMQQRLDASRASVAEMQKAQQGLTDELKAKEEALKAHNALLEDMARLEKAATEVAAQRDQSRIDAMMTRGKQVFADTRTEVEKFSLSLQELNRLYLFGAVDVETYNRAVEKLDAAQIEPMMARATLIFQETRTEAERFQRSLEELGDLHRRGAVDLETYNRRVEQLEQGWSRAAGGADEMKKAQHEVNTLTALFANEAASGFANAIISAENFTDAMRNLAMQLSETILQAILLKAIVGALGSIGGIFGGGGVDQAQFASFQHGGIVPGPIGQPRLAMVHGGEMVTPSDEVGAWGAPAVVQNNQFFPGLPETVRREVWALLPQIADHTTAAVISASDRGGRMSRVMGRRGNR